MLFKIARIHACVVKLTKEGVNNANIRFNAPIEEYWNYPDDLKVDWNDLHQGGFILRRRTGYGYAGVMENMKGYEHISVWPHCLYVMLSEQYGSEWESYQIDIKPILALVKKRTALVFEGEEIIFDA